MLLLLALLAPPSLADSCGAPPTVVADLDRTLTERPGVRAPGALPEGALSAADLEAWFSAFRGSGGGPVSKVFAALADGKSRTLSGEVVRELFAKNGLDLSSILPMDDLDAVVSDGRTVEFRFKFSSRRDQRKGKIITIPGTDTWVLKGGEPVLLRGEPQKLKVQQTVVFTIGPGGLTGLREGDIRPYGGFLAGYVAVDMEQVREPGRVALSDGKYPILVTGADGKPVQSGGRYVTQTYDEWVKISGPFGITRYIGLPAIPGL